MTPKEIKTAICTSVLRGEGVNEMGAAHCEGVLRGLIWALNGIDPGRLRLYSGKDLKDMFDVAGIPAKIEGDACRFDLNDEYIPVELRGPASE
jgi:hypothetical protein